ESHVPDRRRACSVAWEATRRHDEALRGRGHGSMGGLDGSRARTGDSKRKSFNGARRTLVEIEDVLEAVHEPVEAGRLSHREDDAGNEARSRGSIVTQGEDLARAAEDDLLVR